MYAGRADGGLNWWNVKKEKGAEQGEKNCREEVKIQRDFVESRRLLENAETSSADGHETEPLPERVVNK